MIALLTLLFVLLFLLCAWKARGDFAAVGCPRAWGTNSETGNIARQVRTSGRTEVHHSTRILPNRSNPFGLRDSGVVHTRESSEGGSLNRPCCVNPYTSTQPAPRTLSPAGKPGNLRTLFLPVKPSYRVTGRWV